MQNLLNQLSPSQRFWRLLSPDRREIRNVYVYAIFDGLVNLSLPLGIQAIINLIQGGQVSTSWVVLVSLVVLGVAITGVLQIYQLRITENLQQKIFARAAFEFAYRIPRVRMEALYKKHAPELMNRFFDIVSVQKGLSKILIDFSASALQVIFGLVLLSFYHSFFIAFGILLLIVAFGIFQFTAKKGMEKSLEESKYKYRVAHWLQELARTQVSFKLAGSTDLPLWFTDTQVGHYLQAREKHFKVLVQQYSLMVLFQVLVVGGLLAIGGILVMEEQMNIGQFVAAEIIILLVLTSVKKLILSLETIYDVLTSLEKMGQVSDLELESAEGIDLATHCNDCGVDVVINQATLKYPGQIEPVLNKLSMNIESGSKVMITGQDVGATKAVLYTISGMYQLQSGAISVNGYAINSVHPESLRAVIGECFAQQKLFEGTVIENITMGRKNIPLEDVLWAVKNLKLEGFVSNLSKGLNSTLSLNSASVTPDILQKMLLARSVVSKPKLLLLDHPYYHLNKNDRQEIMAFLMGKDAVWTAIVVSSNEDLAQMVDKILVLDKGKLAQEGTYTELASKLNLKNAAYA